MTRCEMLERAKVKEDARWKRQMLDARKGKIKADASL